MSELTLKFVVWCWHRTIQVDFCELRHLHGSVFCHPETCLCVNATEKSVCKNINIYICDTDNVKLPAVLTRLFLDYGRMAEHQGENCEAFWTDIIKGLSSILTMIPVVLCVCAFSLILQNSYDLTGTFITIMKGNILTYSHDYWDYSS